MMHTWRVYRVSRITSPADLSQKLVEHTWCSCNAFRVTSAAGIALTFYNDSTSPDGAQEYAVYRNGRQVESLTVSWYESSAKLERDIRALLAGDIGTDMGSPMPREDHPEGACPHCA